MKSGSKYYPLFEHLQRHQAFGTESLTLPLSEIENILNSTLPASAAKRTWWSNRSSPSALQAGAWVLAGYHVSSVDFDAKTVTFEKFEAGYSVTRTGDAVLWDQTAIRALRKHMGLTQAKFAEELGVRRQTVSEWENGVYEPDRSTTKHLARIAELQSFE